MCVLCVCCVCVVCVVCCVLCAVCCVLCGVGACFAVSWSGVSCGVLVWTALPGTALPLDRPKFRSFFPSPTTQNSFFSSLSGCLLVEILVVFLKAGTLKCARLGSPCETPAVSRPSHDNPKNSKRAHLSAPALQTPKFHEKTNKRGRKERILRREREKKARNFGPPTLLAPIFSGFGPPTLRALRTPTLRTPTLRTTTLRTPTFRTLPPFELHFLGFGSPLGHHPSGPHHWSSHPLTHHHAHPQQTTRDNSTHKN